MQFGVLFSCSLGTAFLIYLGKWKPLLLGMKNQLRLLLTLDYFWGKWRDLPRGDIWRISMKKWKKNLGSIAPTFLVEAVYGFRHNTNASIICIICIVHIKTDVCVSMHVLSVGVFYRKKSFSVTNFMVLWTAFVEPSLVHLSLKQLS